ncbi:MAG: FadR/GntR family transcriptional regulator [Anaerolineaceae bacterium]
MQFGELKKQSVAESVSIEILEMIRSKELHPGDKLPAERELSTQLGISRPSLREALRALAIMNVIEIRQGDGVYITSLQADKLVEHLEFVFSLDNSTVFQLFEARKVIEPGASRIAAVKANEQEVRYLQELGAMSVQNQDQLDKFAEADFAIHCKIVEIAQNPFLSRINSSLTFLSRSSRQHTGRIPGVIRQTVTDHENIIRAISNHDPEEAYNAMFRHLEHVESIYRQDLEKKK